MARDPRSWAPTFPGQPCHSHGAGSSASPKLVPVGAPPLDLIWSRHGGWRTSAGMLQSPRWNFRLPRRPGVQPHRSTISNLAPVGADGLRSTDARVAREVVPTSAGALLWAGRGGPLSARKANAWTGFERAALGHLSWHVTAAGSRAQSPRALEARGSRAMAASESVASASPGSRFSWLRYQRSAALVSPICR